MDNLRKFRREIAGRGVNMHERMVAGAAAGQNILVPDLKDGDAIVSVIDLTGPAAKTLDMQKKASVTLFGTNKVIKFEALYPGVGDKIYVQVLKASHADAVAKEYAKDRTTVDVVPHSSVKDANIIRVFGAVDGSDVITLTAAAAVVAVNIHPEAQKLVKASLSSGNGSTALTATGPHKLGASVTGDVSASVVGYNHSQGPKAAHADIGSGTAEVTVVAAIPGAAGNSITVEVEHDATAETPIVTVDGNTVTIAADLPITAGELASAINAQVGALLKAFVKTAGSDLGPDSATLANGRDTGRIRLVEATTSEAAVKVLWFGRA